MKIKDALLDSYHEGELSNRLYALDELNRRERDLSDQYAHRIIAGCAGLGLLMIAAAIVSALT